MKSTKVALIVLSLAVAANAQTAPPASNALREAEASSTVGKLSEERIEEIYIGQNLVTTLSFNTKRQIQKVTLGSHAVEATYDKELNTVELRATIAEGATNMNIVIDNKVYRFVVFVVKDQRKFYARTYSMEEEEGGLSAARALAGEAPVMRPDQIDVNRLVTIMDRARMDGQFRKAYRGMEVVPIGKTYAWNASPVTFYDVTHFPEIDTLVFRLEFMNRTDKALYLHARQYKIYVANKEIHHTVRMQRSSTLFPGQVDRVYLFVQGRRIDPVNNWELVLPPESDAVRRVLGGR